MEQTTVCQQFRATVWHCCYLEPDNFCLRTSPVHHYKMIGRLPTLRPVDASATSPPMQLSQLKMLPDITKCALGTKLPPFKKHCSKVIIEERLEAGTILAGFRDATEFYNVLKIYDLQKPNQHISYFSHHQKKGLVKQRTPI